jgi:hypothetical protein
MFHLFAFSHLERGFAGCRMDNGLWYVRFGLLLSCFGLAWLRQPCAPRSEKSHMGGVLLVVIWLRGNGHESLAQTSIAPVILVKLGPIAAF